MLLVCGVVIQCTNVVQWRIREMTSQRQPYVPIVQILFASGLNIVDLEFYSQTEYPGVTSQELKAQVLSD